VEGGIPGIGNGQMAGSSSSRKKSVVRVLRPISLIFSVFDSNGFIKLHLIWFVLFILFICFLSLTTEVSYTLYFDINFLLCCIIHCARVWCGVVWCGVVWCGVVWCGVECATGKYV
jgi:hypothetical protein